MHLSTWRPFEKGAMTIGTTFQYFITTGNVSASPSEGGLDSCDLIAQLPTSSAWGLWSLFVTGKETVPSICSQGASIPIGFHLGQGESAIRMASPPGNSNPHALKGLPEMSWPMCCGGLSFQNLNKSILKFPCSIRKYRDLNQGLGLKDVLPLHPSSV